MTVHDGEEKVFTTPREPSAPKREGQENKSPIIEILVYLVPALCIFGATIGLYGIASKYFVGFSNQMGSDFVTATIIGGLTFAIGWVTYLFREKKRVWYAVLEIAVASASAVVIWHEVSAGSARPLPSVMGILGAIYISVRGFDNFFKGRKEAAEKVASADKKELMDKLVADIVDAAKRAKESELAAARILVSIQDANKLQNNSTVAVAGNANAGISPESPKA